MKNNKGFTVIELIVIIVIVGILAAVAIPKFIKEPKQLNKQPKYQYKMVLINQLGAAVDTVRCMSYNLYRNSITLYDLDDGRKLVEWVGSFGILQEIEME